MSKLSPKKYPKRIFQEAKMQSQEKFFLGGGMGGGRKADKKRRKNFVLGPPYFRAFLLSSKFLTL